MSRAEERALMAYPIMEVPDDTTLGFTTYDKNELLRNGFIKGYGQAIKESTLTPEDIIVILNLAKEHSPEETAKLFNKTRQ